MLLRPHLEGGGGLFLLVRVLPIRVFLVRVFLVRVLHLLLRCNLQFRGGLVLELVLGHGRQMFLFLEAALLLKGGIGLGVQLASALAQLGSASENTRLWAEGAGYHRQERRIISLDHDRRSRLFCAFITLVRFASLLARLWYGFFLRAQNNSSSRTLVPIRTLGGGLPSFGFLRLAKVETRARIAEAKELQFQGLLAGRRFGVLSSFLLRELMPRQEGESVLLAGFSHSLHGIPGEGNPHAARAAELGHAQNSIVEAAHFQVAEHARRSVRALKRFLRHPDQDADAVEHGEAVVLEHFHDIIRALSHRYVSNMKLRGGLHDFLLV